MYWQALIIGSLLPLAAHAQTRLPAMERDIQSGKFQKIGSILIEQDGKLVYEHYFEKRRFNAARHALGD